MKTLKSLIIALFLSSNLMAQFTVMQPETFRLSTVANYPCPSGHTGKIFYNTTSNKLAYCEGEYNSQEAGEYWDEVAINSINYTGKIGINNPSPVYELDMLGEIRASNIIAEQLGIGTTTPTEKVELINRTMAVSSTADANTFRFTYQDASDRFDLLEGGLPRMSIANGGTVGIGQPTTTYKLFVSGDVNFDGNLTIEGKGIAYNATAPQLVLRTTTFTTGSSFFVSNNTCQTWGFSWSNPPFTAAPAVAIGQVISGSANAGEMVITVEAVTISSGTARFCNHSGGDLSLANTTFSVIAIGQ